jgi:chromate reductase, NAD(P)H dehydrogenase (quinone)
MTSLLILSGSARAASLNKRLALVAQSIAQSLGVRTELIHLGDLQLPIYDADLEAQGTPAAALQLKASMLAHPGWVMCSPEYNGSTTALLKNAIDWASSPAVAGQLHSAEAVAPWRDGLLPFRGKVVGLLSASPGAMGGLRSLSAAGALLHNLHCWVAPEQFALGRAHEAFAPDGNLKDSATQAKVAAVVNQVLWASSKLGS